MKKIALTGIVLAMGLVTVACQQNSSAAEVPENQVEVVENQKDTETLNAEEKDDAMVEEDTENTDTKKNLKDDTEKEETDADTKETAKEEKTYSVTRSYPSTDYIVDGKEDAKTKTASAEIKASESDIVKKVLDRLAQDPAAEGAEPTGLDKFDYAKSKLDGTTAKVDIAGNASGGSLEEDVIVTSVVNSLLSVDGIQSVEFTVNGKPAETLMGHVDITEPFTAPL